MKKIIYLLLLLCPLSISAQNLIANSIQGRDTTYLLNRSHHTGALPYTALSGTPTTLSGYGITNGVASTDTSAMLNRYLRSATAGSTYIKIADTSSMLVNYLRTVNFSTNFTTQLATKTTSNLMEGSNLYYTDARARAAILLTTSGTSGSASYSSGTLNIPQYSNTCQLPELYANTTPSFATATAYYFGASYTVVLSTTPASNRFYICKSGIISYAILYVTYSGSPTSISTPVAIVLNNTTTTSLGNINFGSGSPQILSTSTSISVIQGDFIECKLGPATMAATPTSVVCRLQLLEVF